LGATVQCALEGVEGVVQRAAVRRIDSDGLIRARLQPDENTGLGAMSMQHVKLRPGDQLPEAQPDLKIGRPGFAVDRYTMHAEGKTRGDLLEHCVGAFAA